MEAMALFSFRFPWLAANGRGSRPSVDRNVKNPVADVEAMAPPAKKAGEGGEKTLDNWAHHGVLYTGYAMLCETDLLGGLDLPDMEAGKRRAWSQRVFSLD